MDKYPVIMVNKFFNCGKQLFFLMFIIILFIYFPAGRRRCHKVVFARSLLQPKTNVVTTLCFRRRFSDMLLTLQQRRDSDAVFLTKI